jgi:hypothetical protein
MGRGYTLGIHLEHLVIVLALDIATRQREKRYCMLTAAASIVMLEPLNQAAFKSAFFVPVEATMSKSIVTHIWAFRRH